MSGFLPAWLLYVLAAGVSSCLGNLALKYSRMLAAPDAGFIEKMLSPWFLAGLACYGINVILFAKALDNAPVSVAYPVLAVTGFLLLAVAAAALFGERLSLSQWAGLALALVSIFLLARPA